jgi:hypothetical protein
MRLPDLIEMTGAVASGDCQLSCAFDFQPAEPEVNCPASVTLTAAYRVGQGDVMGAMSQDEIEVLEEALLIEVQALIAEDYEMQQDWRYYA